jgi:hypothetical protein
MSRKMSNNIEATRAQGVEEEERRANKMVDMELEKMPEVHQEKYTGEVDSSVAFQNEDSEKVGVEMALPRAPEMENESPRNDLSPKIEDMLQAKAMETCGCIIC